MLSGSVDCAVVKAQRIIKRHTRIQLLIGALFASRSDRMGKVPVSFCCFIHSLSLLHAIVSSHMLATDSVRESRIDVSASDGYCGQRPWLRAKADFASE